MTSIHFSSGSYWANHLFSYAYTHFYLSEDSHFLLHMNKKMLSPLFLMSSST